MVRVYVQYITLFVVHQEKSLSFIINRIDTHETPTTTGAAFRGPKEKGVVQKYLLLYNKNIQFDFDDELKLRDFRYDNMT